MAAIISGDLPASPAVPKDRSLLRGMTKKAKPAISHLHPQLSWAQKGLLEFIWQHDGCTKATMKDSAPAADYAHENRLRELKKLGLIEGRQQVKPGGGRARFGESLYYVTDLARGVPAGTEK